MDEVQKEKIVSVNFSHAVFCLLFALGEACLGLALRGLVWCDLIWRFTVNLR